MADDTDDVLADAKEAYEAAAETWAENFAMGLDDLKFARLGEQWPEQILAQRQRDGRPALTINKQNAFIRQVVNDTRQNKPSIKVRPADSGADVETADIISGLIRNIEYTSNAEVAYDTAVEGAASNGFGFLRVNLDYAHDDTFDLDLVIQRIGNPFSVLGDPASTAADSSDWNVAFVVDRLSRADFERQYKGADPVNWDADYAGLGTPWIDGDDVLVAEWWTREEYDRPIVQLSDGSILGEDRLKASPELQQMVAAGALQIVRQRVAKCWRVKQRILTGAEIVESNDWPGRYIPIVPVYGDEVNVEGTRYFRSLIRDAKDAQRQYNYWRTAATELVALAPRVPFIGPEGFASVDPEKWSAVNQASLPYLEYKPNPSAVNGGMPVRQPLDTGTAAGALQEALNANDDMKAITGLYDASLGARSNETSGRAILARQREGDVSTFHFADNLSRAIRHTGRILIDLIPQVYSGERIVRVIGEDGKEQSKQLGTPVPVMGPDGKPQMQQDPATGQQVPLTRVYDLAAGKYDLTVSTGPSYTTRREEAAAQMTELVRAFPQGATVIAPELAKNMDWPGADKIAERFEALAPQPGGQAIPPQLQQAIQKGQQTIQQQAAELQQLKADRSVDQARLQLDARKVAIEEQKARTAQFEAETARLQAMKPEPTPVYRQAGGTAAA